MGTLHEQQSCQRDNFFLRLGISVSLRGVLHEMDLKKVCLFICLFVFTLEIVFFSNNLKI